VSEIHTFFVYGSLKEGFGNHGCLAGAFKLGEGVTREQNYMMRSLGGFPGVYEVGGSGEAIWGEVYEGDNEVQRRLDRLEGHPNFYRRHRREITLTDGQVVTAWIYLLPLEDLERFENRVQSERIERIDLDHTMVANWLPRASYCGGL
jgi:gamma-glutamylaminecyclotransferase